MIRIYDSSTVRYKCQNEIIAKDMNWCILDIAFSPGSEYFVYSTWSSCRKWSSSDSDFSWYRMDYDNRQLFDLFGY